ncbi:MAG: hypothetical protein WD556_11740 [Actinomycetota bacterium]
MGRYFITITGESEGFPEWGGDAAPFRFVVAEVPEDPVASWFTTPLAASPDLDARETARRYSRGEVWTEQELVSEPGGREALAAWRAGDDRLFRLHELQEQRRMVEDELDWQIEMNETYVGSEDLDPGQREVVTQWLTEARRLRREGSLGDQEHFRVYAGRTTEASRILEKEKASKVS